MLRQEIVFATGNTHKVQEAAEKLEKTGLTVLSLKDLGLNMSVAETGSTFAENARIKAEYISARTELPVFADDSGLVVDALDGRPGIYSARFAGAHGNDDANIDRLLAELDTVPDEARGAAFVCAVCYIDKSTGQRGDFEGRCSGMITRERRGTQGFGYDPVFYLPDRQVTMAELPLPVKNSISHRARALTELAEWLSSAQEHS